MPYVRQILVASDAHWVINEIEAALSSEDAVIQVVNSGIEVRQAVEKNPPDLVIVDLQIGNMGGMAVAIDLHLEQGAERIEHVPVLMLLDRRADVFLAKRSHVEGWILKPLDSLRLRRAATALLDGGTYHDTTGAPVATSSAETLPIA